MVFISCHLEAGNKFEERRAQYQELSYELGGKLGHGAGVDLGTQFHHIVWVGDLNYRCVQGAEPGHRDKSFPGDRAIALLEQVKSTPATLTWKGIRAVRPFLTLNMADARGVVADHDGRQCASESAPAELPPRATQGH